MSGANRNAPAGGTARGAGDEHRGALADDHSTRGRRLPPYAKRQAARLRDPNATVWVVTGPAAWRWAHERINGNGYTWNGPESTQLVVVAPVDDDPTAMDWRGIAGHDPVLLVRVGDVDGAFLRALVEALMRDGVRRVLGQDGTLFEAVRA